MRGELNVNQGTGGCSVESDIKARASSASLPSDFPIHWPCPKGQQKIEAYLCVYALAYASTLSFPYPTCSLLPRLHIAGIMNPIASL